MRPSRLGSFPMHHQVQLNEKLYKEAQRRAELAGFSSVDEYIADVVSQDLLEAGGEDGNHDHLFTPQIIAELDQISAEIRAGGKTYTLDEVERHFEKKREEWLQNHAG